MTKYTIKTETVNRTKQFYVLRNGVACHPGYHVDLKSAEIYKEQAERNGWK